MEKERTARKRRMDGGAEGGGDETGQRFKSRLLIEINERSSFSSKGLNIILLSKFRDERTTFGLGKY